MVINLLKMVACHLVGDYVLQSDYLAREKGRNWYVLLVHCFLYCIPFGIVFGLDFRLPFIFLWHVVIDAGKARYNKFGIGIDQFLHYLVGLVYIV